MKARTHGEAAVQYRKIAVRLKALAKRPNPWTAPDLLVYLQAYWFHLGAIIESHAQEISKRDPTEPMPHVTAVEPCSHNGCRAVVTVNASTLWLLRKEGSDSRQWCEDHNPVVATTPQPLLDASIDVPTWSARLVEYDRLLLARAWDDPMYVALGTLGLLDGFVADWRRIERVLIEEVGIEGVEEIRRAANTLRFFADGFEPEPSTVPFPELPERPKPSPIPKTAVKQSPETSTDREPKPTNNPRPSIGFI